MTKTLHGAVDDFHIVISAYPNSFKIDRSKGSQKMRFFTILNKRAHAFVCETCRFIKIATVKNSTLRNPDDYKIRHECSIGPISATSDNDTMGSASSSMGSAQVSSENDTMQTASETSGNTSTQSAQVTSDNSMLTASTSSMHGLENILQQSFNSENQSTSELSSSMNSTSDINASDSISIDESMASNRSYESSSANDSGFRTPEFLDESSQNPPIPEHRCTNRFTQLSGSLNMELVIKCQFATNVVSEIVDHKAVCPLRYRSKMAQSNPAYLSKILWSFAKELPVSDYLGMNYIQVHVIEPIILG